MDEFEKGYQYEENNYKPGNYRVSILNAEDTTSQSGNKMYKLELDVNGLNLVVNHYIVKNQFFNQNMSRFFDCFNVDKKDFNLFNWVGATGAVRLKVDDQGYLKVSSLISKTSNVQLPDWVGPVPERETITIPAANEEDEAPL